MERNDTIVPKRGKISPYVVCGDELISAKLVKINHLTDILGNAIISIRVIEHRDITKIGKQFKVNSKYFDLK